MSLDKSLKSNAGLERHRNVLTRIERIEKLKEQDRWPDDHNPYGLPKVVHRKAKVGGHEKKPAQEETAAETTEGTEPKPEGGPASS